MTTNTLARKTLRRINDALDKGQTGAMGEIVQVVRKLSGEVASVSIADLSELIARDPNITQKVVSAANTFGYNPTGVEIGTITEALHTVGFERIRNLTLSLMLAENAGNATDSDEQREMAALSVCSGMLAQKIVRDSVHASADPELAFVGTSLRNYGKLLMSTFCVDEYVEAREQAKEMSSDEAFESILGITPLALGHTLLKSTNLPDIIMSALEAVPQEKIMRSAQTEAEEVVVTAEFCSQVCEIAFDESLNPEAFEKKLNSVISTFGESVPIDFTTIIEALEAVDEQMSQLNQIIGIKDSSSPANQKLRSRVNGKPLKQSTAKLRKPARKASVDFTKAPMGLSEIPDTLEGVLEAMAQKETSGEVQDLGEIYEAINAAVMSELKLDGCMTFLEDVEKTGGARFSARHGVGLLYDRVKNRPLLAKEKKDIFSICLARREDILIQDTKAGKIASVIPEWIHDRGDVSSLIVLPASVGDSLFAVFVGTKNNAGGVEMEPTTHKRLRQFRNDLAKLKGITQ